MTVYGVCDNNCKHPVYTQEEVLAILQQAINDGTLSNIDADYAAIKKIIDINGGSDVKFWTGTEAEFNALGTLPDVSYFIPRRAEDGTIYICIDDSHIGAIPDKPMTADDVDAICNGGAGNNGDYLGGVALAALWEKVNAADDKLTEDIIEYVSEAGVKIATGTYKGNNKASLSLTLPFVPKFLFITKNLSDGTDTNAYSHVFAILVDAPCGLSVLSKGSSNRGIGVSVSDTTVKITNSNYNFICNDSVFNYAYVAIG